MDKTLTDCDEAKKQSDKIIQLEIEIEKLILDLHKKMSLYCVKYCDEEIYEELRVVEKILLRLFVDMKQCPRMVK